MRKIRIKLVFLTVSVLLHTVIQAQLVHTKGSMSLGLDGGYVLDGYHVGSRYSYLLAGSSTLSAYFKYEKNYFEVDNFDLLFYGVDYKFTYFKYGNWLYFDIGTGFFLSNEFSDSPIFGKVSKFAIGETVFLDVDYYLTTKLIVSACFGQRFHQLSNLGKLSWYAGLGIYYNINKTKKVKSKFK